MCDIHITILGDNMDHNIIMFQKSLTSTLTLYLIHTMIKLFYIQHLSKKIGEEEIRRLEGDPHISLGGSLRMK